MEVIDNLPPHLSGKCRSIGKFREMESGRPAIEIVDRTSGNTRTEL
jgi:hypothetical protein